MSKATFNNKKALFTSKLDLNLKKKLASATFGAELYMVLKPGHFRKQISWTNCVKNEKVLQRVKEGTNTLQTIEKRKANLIGHILHWKCLLKHVMEGKIKGRIEVTQEDEEEEVSSYWMDIIFN